MAAEQAYLKSLPEVERKEYIDYKEKTQKLVKDYQELYTVLHTNPKKKQEVDKAPNPEAMLLAVRQDIAPIIRMMLTNDFVANQVNPDFNMATEANIDVLTKEYNNKLNNLFSANNPNRAALEAKARSTYASLVKDQELGKSIKADDNFFADLLNETSEEKDKRINWVFEKVPKPMQSQINDEKIKAATLIELNNIASTFNKIEFIVEKTNILGKEALSNQVKDFISNFDSLSSNDKIDLFINKEIIQIFGREKIDKTTLDDLEKVKKNWLKDKNNIGKLLTDKNISYVKLDNFEQSCGRDLDAKQLIDFYSELAETKAALISSKTDFSSTKLSENEISDEIRVAFSKLLASEEDKRKIVELKNKIHAGKKQLNETESAKFSRLLKRFEDDRKYKNLLQDKKKISDLVSRIDSSKLLKKFKELGNKNPDINFEDIKNSCDNLKKSEEVLLNKRKTAKDEKIVAPVATLVVGMENVEITSTIGKKIQHLIGELPAGAPLAANNDKRNVATEQMRLKARKNEAVNTALGLVLTNLELDRVRAAGEDCNDEILGKITREVMNVLNQEYQGEKNELFIRIEDTLNDQYKAILEDKGLVALLSQDNQDFLQKIQNVTGVAATEIEKTTPAAPATNTGHEIRNAEVPARIVVEGEPAPATVVENAPIAVNAEVPAEGGNEPEAIAEPEAVAEGNAQLNEDVEAPEPNEPNEAVVEAEEQQAPEEEVENGEALAEDAQDAPAALEIAAPAPAPVSNEDRNNSEPEDKKGEDSEKINTDEDKIAIEEGKKAEEEKIIEAMLKAAEDSAIQTAVKEDKEMVGATHNSSIIHNIQRINSDIMFTRMKNFAAVAAGDEDETVLDKGVWVSAIYGTNKQGSQKGFAGYKGHASGVTIGFDIGFDNFKDLIGIAYTKLDSKFKSRGSKLHTNIDSHILALYAQKELPKNFMIQGMFAYNHNIMKSKVNRLGTIANGKYKNDNYNFEGLLSYNYRASNNIILTPNIGVRYGHIKDGTYQENGIGIQHLSIASKKQHLWTGIIGGSVTFAPQKITEGLSITPSLQGSVENYFNSKSKKLDTKVKWNDREINEIVALPKQPKIGYNIGGSVLAEKGNISVTLEYNCHLQKKYQSHQGFVKLKVKL